MSLFGSAKGLLVVYISAPGEGLKGDHARASCLVYVMAEQHYTRGVNQYASYCVVAVATRARRLLRSRAKRKECT